MSAMEQVGLRLTGDTSDLQRALQQGGRQVQDFARGAERDMGKAADAAQKVTDQGIKLSHVMGLLTAREVMQIGWRAMTGELSQFEQAMVGAQTTAEKLRNTLNFAVGRDVAGRDMAFLRETTHALGLEFISTAQQYARLAASARGTNMEGEATRELFVAIAQASTVLGLSVDETEGSFRAVQQMLSKGKVQAEELRGQLGERLPGAFQIAARAMGVTTAQLDKMLEQGQIYADDFLPKFAAQLKKELGGSVAEASNSAQAATNRFTNSYNEFKQALADAGIYEQVAKRQGVVAESFHGMAKEMREAKAEGDGFWASFGRAFAQDIGLRNPFTGISASVRDNAEELKYAQERYKELQRLTDNPHPNIYLQSEKAELAEYIGRLEKALGLKRELTGNELGAIASGEAIRAKYPTRSQSYEREERRQAAGRSQVAALRNKALGIEDTYLNQLNDLERLEREGFLTFNDRREIAQRLTSNQFKKPHAEKNSEADSAFRQISERTTELRLQQQSEEDLTTAQKLAAKVLDDLRTGHLKLSEAEKVRMGSALQLLLLEDKSNTAKEKAKKLQEENAKIIEKNTEAADKAAEAAHRKVDQEVEANQRLQEEIATIGMNEEQRTRFVQLLEQEKIARLELDLATAQNIEGNEAQVAAIEREIEVRKQRLQLLDRKAEAQHIQAIRDEWEKASDQIADSLTDALMRGFENGKDAAENLRDTVKNMFKTLVLRPLIQGVLAPVTGTIGGAGQPLGNALWGGIAGGGGGGAGGSLGSGLMNNMGLVGAGVQAATGMWAGASAASLGYANMVGAVGGDALGALIAANGGWAGVSAGAAAGAGAGGAAAAGGAGAAGAAGAGAAAVIPVIGWVVAIAALLYSVFGKKGGGPKIEGFYNPYSADPFFKDNNNQVAESSQQAANTLQAQYQSYIATFGGNAALQYGLGYSMDPRGTAPTMLNIGAGRDGQGVFNVSRNDIGREQEDLQKAIAEMGSRAILIGLQQSNLGGKIGDYVRSLTIEGMSDSAVAAAMARLQKASQERGNIEQRLFDMTATAAEKLTRTRQRERDAIDETNRALLDQIYNLEDLQNGLNSAIGNLQAAVERERQGAQQRLEEVSGILGLLDDALKSYRTDARTGLQRDEAMAQIQTMLAIAKASGVLPDQDKLRDALEVVARPSADLYSSFTDYVSARDREAASIGDLADLTRDEKTVAEQQLEHLDSLLAEAQAQLDAINGTTAAVLTVNEALTALHSAFDAYAAGKQAAKAAMADELKPSTATPPPLSTAPAAKPVDPYFMSIDGESGAIEWWVDRNTGAPITDPELLARLNASRRRMYSPEPGYATGGAFTNGIVSRPTMFNVKEMGEAGPEAIMPLVNVGGSLGVRALATGDAGTTGAIEKLQQQLDDQHAALRAMAGFLSRTTRAIEWIRDRGVTVNTDADTPLQVHTV